MTGSSADAIVVLVTCKGMRQAVKIARTLVRERLAACATVRPQGRSFYWWEGKVADEFEVLVVAKTRAALFPALDARVRAIHSYQVPEVLALPVAAGSAAYLAWLSSETRPA